MNPWARKSALVVALLACAAPLFVLTVHGWSPAMLFIACALAIVLLAAGRLPAIERDAIRPALLVIAALAAPLVATILSAALRGDWYGPQFDAPLRPALGIPVFLVALRCRLDASRGLRWTLPLALVLVVAHRAWFG